jgi:hypothetical protein
MRNNFLILGNGADINEIDFDKIDGNLATGGVNRIYLKYLPEHYFIYDLIEIMPDIPKLSGYCFYTHTSKLVEYLKENVNNTNIFMSFPEYNYTTEFDIKGHRIKCNHSPVNFLIRIIDDYLYNDDENYFYICGVPLLERVGHFYDEAINHTPQKVLDRIFNDFIRLAWQGYNIISCMKESKLNDIFPNEDKNILYNFKEKEYIYPNNTHILNYIKERKYALSQ